MARSDGAHASAVSAAVPPGAVAHIATSGSLPDFAGACRTDNPYLVTACYTSWAYGMPVTPQPKIAMVVAFRDTPYETTNHWLATYQQVGAVWGLAYHPVEHAVYAAAFHKRRLGFGVGGAGGIYRIDLASDKISRLIRVPDAGFVRTFSWNDSDIRGQNASGKNSLGDLDIGGNGGELYVTNLNNRRIYRFSLPGGDQLGSFLHGASQESWAHDARPFALKFHDGRLYHGVVNSAESTQRTADLAAHVCSSEPDGSHMREVARVPLDYSRGVARIRGILNNPPLEVPLEWQPWKDGGSDLLDNRGTLAVYPQPILADIEFDSAGRMLLGFADRQSIMTWQKMVLPNPDPSKPGLGIGDALIGVHGSQLWRFQLLPEHFNDQTGAAEEGLQGGIAWIERAQQAVFGGLTDRGIDYVQYGVDMAYWYAMDGSRARREQPCSERALFATPAAAEHTARVSDNERNPSASMGDLEVLCAPPESPTATSAKLPTATSTPTDPRTRRSS